MVLLFLINSRGETSQGISGAHSTMESNPALTELPFDLPGRVFRSPMPFSAFDPDGELLAVYHREGISTIVLLAPDEECLRLTGKELRALYALEGFEVIYLPIQDMGVPAQSELDRSLAEAMEKAQSGCHLVIHCYAGVGRTGTFSACLAKRILGLNGERAIAWVRRYIPRAIETEGQTQLVASC